MNLKKFPLAVILACSMSAHAQQMASTPPTISGTQIFPPNNVWNTPVDELPAQRPIDGINDHGGHNLHPDFGTVYNGLFNGIPVNVVSGQMTPPVRVNITTYASESDVLPGGNQSTGFLPIPANVAIESDPPTSPSWDAGADLHLLLIDSDTHTLHELYNAIRQADGSIVAKHYSHWDLNSNALRPDFLTSSDAAGLPVAPGLVRYDQVQACLAVDPQGLSCTLGHALRFTLDLTHGPHIWPARHDANTGGANNPPFGLRVRLKADIATSAYSPTNRVILNTLKKYGALLADNGGDWFFQGSPDPRWNDGDLRSLSQLVPSQAFEVVDTSRWIVNADSGQANPTGSGLPVETYPKPGAVLALDFDDPTNVVTAPGFRSFATNAYSPSVGYGWQSAAGLGWRSRSVSSDPLWKDIVITESPSQQTFLVDIPNGTYSVTLFLGDPEYSSNQGLTVSAAGTPQFTLLKSAPGEKLVKTFSVTVSGGRLTLQFGATIQGSGLSLAGLEIDPVASPIDPVVPPPSINAAPLVNAGADGTLNVSGVLDLGGTVSDDGLPDGTLIAAWAQVSGPGTVTFGNPAAFSTTAAFSMPGTYILALTASDGLLTSTDDVTITVNPTVQPPATPPPPISNIQIFPANNVWNTPVDTLPAQRPIDITTDHGGHSFHADFGTMYNGLFNGMPVNVVSGSATPQVRVNITNYASESDPLPGGDQTTGFLPIPGNVAIEGDPATSPAWDAGEDHHLLLIDSDTHMLHELYNAIRQSDGSILAKQYSRWDLNSNLLRPDSWTSSDAAGLPVTPGLVRYDQVQSCLVLDPQGSWCTLGHALRFTLNATHGPHLWPARHDANTGNETNPPFGLRVRLKSSLDVSAYSPTNRVILNTLKKYGAILADNGGDWFFQGSPDPRWDDQDLHSLVQILPYEHFEVIDTSGCRLSADSGECVNAGARDNVAPVIAITNPLSGTVSGMLSLQVTATDDIGVAHVEFLLDGAVGVDDTSAPFQQTLDTTTLSNGVHTLGARAYDAAGNIGTAQIVTIDVENGDTTPPTIAIKANMDSRFNVTVTANTFDNIGVVRVEFFLNGALASTDFTDPYSAVMRIWMPPWTVGSFTVVAKAYDAAGNVGTSLPLTLVWLHSTETDIAAADYLDVSESLP